MMENAKLIIGENVITKLTKEQENKITLQIQKWVDKASIPMNHDKAFLAIDQLYSKMKEGNPIKIVGTSPFNTAMLASLFWMVFNKEEDSQLDTQLRSQLYSQLDSQLGSQLDSQLYSQLYSQLDSQLGSINNDWYMNLWWMAWCGWYEFGKHIGVEYTQEVYDLFVMFNSEINFIIPYKGVCFISEKPTKINWDNGLLHNDGGLAVEYSDGYGLYSLNGVTVPEYLAITPESELDLEFYKKETNADVKAEFIRKYGIDRMVSFGRVIDSYKNYDHDEWWVKSEYELIDMESIFSSVDYAPHIKMKNQTTGTFHLEGVDPQCRNLKQAMDWREQIKNEKFKTLSIK